jgi:hypothetical protein
MSDENPRIACEHSFYSDFVASQRFFKVQTRGDRGVRSFRSKRRLFLRTTGVSTEEQKWFPNVAQDTFGTVFFEVLEA